MLNEMICRLRKARGISQVELARRLGVTKQSVCNWENDNIQPSIEMLLKLAKEFAVSTDYLLGLTSRTQLDVSDLSEETVAHLRLLVNDLRQNK